MIVVAAGNEGVDVSKYGIAGSDKVLTVASTGFDDQRAVFSNWGKVSVAAPGLDILSLRARRTDTMLGIEGVKYDRRRGLCRRGQALLPRQRHLVLGAAGERARLADDRQRSEPDQPAGDERSSRARRATSARPGVDQYTGYGIIDARAALKAPKDYLLAAGIERVEVVQKGGKQAVRVRGTADANALKSARIEIGQGEAPTSWKQVGAAKKNAGPDGVLGEIPATAFAGREGLADTRDRRAHERGDTGSTVQIESGLAAFCWGRHAQS